MIGDSDLGLFFSANDFGVSATVNGSTITGIFLNGFESVQSPLFDAEIMSNAPYFIAQSSDVVASEVDNAANNTVTISGINYKVKSINPDGTGITKLELFEAT